ncbi:unnamed protein product [Discula destructiva]
MNGHAITKSSLSYEEKLSLLDEEKSLSDIDSEAGRSENDAHFPSAHEWASFSKRAVTGLSLPKRILSRSYCRALMTKLCLFFLPSFVSSRLSHERPGSQRLGPTAYLDGMRGLAAFIVFFCHYFYTCFIIADGWGSNDANYDILKLPFLRLMYAGPPMVAIFFIVSGYALSLKPLKLARSQKWTDFATTMSSFVFRRALRLFLPAFASTLLIVVLLRVGAYEWNRDFSKDPQFHWNVQETAPDRKATLTEQLTDWFWNMFNFVHVWGWEKYGGSTYYDVHLWTIPIEFRASMMLFLTLVGFARLRTAVRMGCLAVVTAFSYRWDRWEMVLFYTGMLYAELDIIRGAHTNPATTAALQTQQHLDSSSSSSSSSSTGLPSVEPKPIDYVGTGNQSAVAKSSRLSRVGWGMLTTVSLYLLSQPDVNSEHTPGWVTLSSYIPEWVDDKYRYFQCVGAIMFVFCTARMPTLQRVFNSPPVQYLGKISYAIYLMHGPVLHTVGYSIEKWAWRMTGTEGPWYVVGFGLAALGVVPCVVWAADVFWRAVDAPVVRFAKWLEGQCVVGEEKKDGYGRL